MNPDIKQRWINALRSGDYAQTHGALHRLNDDTVNPAGYCCLGVLCELAVEDNIATVVTSGGNKDFYGTNELSYSGAYLTGDLIDWSGLKVSEGVYFSGADVNPYLTDEDHMDEELESTGHYSLADLNDGGMSFNTIAKLIEVYL